MVAPIRRQLSTRSMSSRYSTPNFEDDELPAIQTLYPSLANLPHFKEITTAADKQQEPEPERTPSMEPIYPSTSMLQNQEVVIDDNDHSVSCSETSVSTLSNDHSFVGLESSPVRVRAHTRNARPPRLSRPNVGRANSLSQLAAMRQSLEKTRSEKAEAGSDDGSVWSQGKAEHLTPPKRSLWKDKSGKSKYTAHDLSDLRVLKRRTPKRAQSSGEGWGSTARTPLRRSQSSAAARTVLSEATPKPSPKPSPTPSPRSSPRRSKSGLGLGLRRMMSDAGQKLAEQRERALQKQKEEEEAVVYAKAFVKRHNSLRNLASTDGEDSEQHQVVSTLA